MRSRTGKRGQPTRATARLPVVGLFVEGAVQVNTSNSVDKLWRRLADHCGAEIELRVYGMDKSQILSLKPNALPRRRNAARTISSREGLDVAISRAIEHDGLDGVIVAFDEWPPNELLPEEGHCAEIRFVLEGLRDSRAESFPAAQRQAAQRLLARYQGNEVSLKRAGFIERLEILYMAPLFEALLASDEKSVMAAMNVTSRGKDWPRGWDGDDPATVVAKAVEAADKDVIRKVGGRYRTHKSAWGLRILAAAAEDATLWQHAIAQRLCRLLHGLVAVPASTR